MAQISIVEKTVGQTHRNAFSLRLASNRISVRDVVAMHVREEVERLNLTAQQKHAERNRSMSFLVGNFAHPLEQKLNQPTTKGPKQLDAEKEIKAALSQISNRKVIMLFDDFEIEELDADLTVTDQSKITFLQLVPLVGG